MSEDTPLVGKGPSSTCQSILGVVQVVVGAGLVAFNIASYFTMGENGEMWSGVWSGITLCISGILTVLSNGGSQDAVIASFWWNLLVNTGVVVAAVILLTLTLIQPEQFEAAKDKFVVDVTLVASNALQFILGLVSAIRSAQSIAPPIPDTGAQCAATCALLCKCCIPTPEVV